MKKLFLFFMVLVATITASAQDVIVKKDGSTVLCRILEVNGSEVIYKKWSDQNGANFIMDRSLISNINYQDGRQEKINEVTSNVYAPGNQQTGESLYNDNALLALDRSRNFDFKNIVKKYNTIAWVAGGGGMVLGVGLITIALFFNGESTECITLLSIGSVIGASGAVLLPLYLNKAYKLRNKMHTISCLPVIQHDFDFKDGSRLSAGIDMIRDNFYKKTTFGLGLQYNF